MDALRESFTTKMAITIPSSLAEEISSTGITSIKRFEVIGRGFAGTVFEMPGTELALKKGSVKASIWADSQMTNLACTAVIECKRAMQRYFPNIAVPRVPRIKDWVKEEDMEAWWGKNSSRFVNVEKGIDDRKRGYVFRVQRIPSLPETVMKALIIAYFPPEEIESALVAPRNRHCLVRPYLGQRRSVRELKQPQDNLENYPLYLDQLVDIGVDVEQYATEMATGLAIVHWRAQLDGMDIEFVIGGAASSEELPTMIPDWRSRSPFTAGTREATRRSLHLWELDFDKASPIDWIGDWETCCRQMVTAVTANDPYFPNPARESKREREIWKVFQRAYLKAAGIIIDMETLLNLEQKKESERLPRRFIEAWKRRAQKQLVYEDGGFVQFG